MAGVNIAVIASGRSGIINWIADHIIFYVIGIDLACRKREQGAEERKFGGKHKFVF